MDSATLVTGLVTITVGALSGGITNAVAIWMLFHPYEARGLWMFRLHGAIPKNKARLARSIGKTVGERLLTPEDLAERLSAPQVRETFDAAMHRLVDESLGQRHGALRDALPPAAVIVLARIVEDLGPRVADRLSEFAATPAFSGLVAGWLARLRNDLADRPVGHLLTPARREVLAEKVNGWVGDLAEGPEMEGTLRAWVEAQVQALERDDRPLSDRLPPSLLAPVEQAIADYLPTAIDQVSGILGDPETRGTVSAALRSAFDGAARQLLIHERLLAKLVVKETTFERLLDGLERSGFDRFAAAITAPAIRDRVAGAVHRAFLGLLRMPLGERLGRLSPEKRAALTRTIGDWVVAASRSPSSRVAIRHGLERALDAAGERTWGEVLAAVPAERAAEALAEALGSEGGRAWVADTVRRAAGTLLEQPIGRPADWLGPETSQAVRDGVATAAWGWVQTQIPAIVARLRLPEMVEQKVLGFSTQRMEEIIRGVTERELQLIVRLGYLLGAFVGLVAFGIGLVIR
jgi:uncharacterized membrane-anchored protein YjiN (DUF445 family)